MNMSSKQIEDILLSSSKEKLAELDSLLGDNYEAYLSSIFEVLFNKISSGNLSDANHLIDNIEKIIFTNHYSNHKTITNIVKDTIYRISSVKIEDASELKIIKYRLLNIIRKANEKKKNSHNYNLYNLYYQLVFKEKNLSAIEEVLKKEKNITSRLDSKGRDFLYNVLFYYASLPEDNIEEINYFYNILILLFKYSEDALIRNNQKYYSLLEEDFCRNKKHVRSIRRELYSLIDIDIKALKKKYDISSHVHDEVIHEMTSFNLTHDGRKILNSHFVTIDGEGSTCLDDALAVSANKDGSYNYYVAITDIPSLVPYKSRTFYDAMRKIETLYLADEVIDLYHPLISHDICSLHTGHNKNAIIYKYLVDPNYNIDLDSMEIIKGVIQVQNRLTYDNVNKQFGLSPFEIKMLEDAYYIAMRLKQNNITKEKYRKVENLLYSNALYHHSLFADKSVSANIIEESMLLVNNSLARYANLHDLVFIYRNHITEADDNLLNEINRLLRIKDPRFAISESSPIYQDIKNFYLNAHYDIENKGHEGLGYNHYCHATSPARRFVDSYIEYLLYLQLFSRIDTETKYELENEVKEVVKHINERKRENAKFQSQYNYLKIREKIKKEVI